MENINPTLRKDIKNLEKEEKFIELLDEILVNKIHAGCSVNYSAAKDFITELHKVGGTIVFDHIII
jgi:hypothetical protein